MVAGDGTGQGGSPGKARESPVGCCSFCLTADLCLVAWHLTLFTRLRDRRQIPHGKRKLSVLLVFNGQTGKLQPDAAEFYTVYQKVSGLQSDDTRERNWQARNRAVATQYCCSLYITTDYNVESKWRDRQKKTRARKPKMGS